MAKLDFKIKVDTSEMVKAITELGVAFQNLQKASIYFVEDTKLKPWYQRFWNWIKKIFKKV